MAKKIKRKVKPVKAKVKPTIGAKAPIRDVQDLLAGFSMDISDGPAAKPAAQEAAKVVVKKRTKAHRAVARKIAKRSKAGAKHKQRRKGIN